MPYSVRIIQLLDKVEPVLKEVLLEILSEIERQRKQWEESVTKSEFNELKAIVAELAEAQKKSEQKLDKLAEAQRKTEQKLTQLAEAQRKTEQRLDQLAEAQRKTEQRLDQLAEAQKKTEQRLDQLAEAQRKTERRLDQLAEAQRKTERRLDQLAEAQRKTERRLDQLAEAQKKTEQRLNQLAEAQEKTEERLNQLAEAQKNTEEELKKLVGEHRKTRKMLGGLTHTVGYVLEDRAYAALPHLLKKDLGVDVIELKRDFVEISPGRYEEINIIGRGKRDAEEVWILGECKSQLVKKDVDNFLKKVARIESIFPGEKLLLLVTYQTPPQVSNYIKEKGLKLYYSYQFSTTF